MANEKNNQTAEALTVLLASSYTLYLKTHNYHWNVTGPMFTTLHTLFETQYTELALAVDEIAERLRALGYPAPGSYAQYAKLSKVADAPDQVPPAKEMIAQLAKDQRTVAEAARAMVELAEGSRDQASADLGTRRIDLHEKSLWMLSAHLE